MTAEEFGQVRDLFDAALDRPADERREWLRAACHENQQLLEEVEQLLGADALAEVG